MFITVILAASLSGSIPVLIALYAVILVVAAASRIPFDFFVKRVWLGIPLFAGLVVIPSIFFVPGPSLFELQLGPLMIAPSIPGIIGAILFVIRVGVSVSLAVLLVLTTPWADLLKSLQAIRVPQVFILVLAMTYRYIFLFLHLANGMFEARKSRVVARTSGAEQRRWIAGTMGNLLNRSVKMSNDVYAAMVARGFTGTIRSLQAYRMRASRLGGPRRRVGGRDRDHRGGADARMTTADETLATAAARATGPAALDPPATERAPAFELHDIRYRYGGRQIALDGIDLRIELGERVALLGANGSGKSTLLKLLDGIIAPSAGTMRALGRDVAAVADGQDSFRFHREVGLVFQDPDIQLFSATVFDDVAFGPLQLGLSDDEVRASCDRGAAPDGHPAPGRSGAIRAVRWREEAGRDRVRPLARSGGPAPRRADRVARPADQVGAGQPDPAARPGRHHARHRDTRARDRARSSPTGSWSSARTVACWRTARPRRS